MRLVISKLIRSKVEEESVLDDKQFTRIFKEKILLFAALLSARHLRRKNRTYFNNCNSKWLKAVLGRHFYNKVLNYLLANNIIEANNHYTVAHFPKSYRVKAEFLTDLEATDFDYTPKAVRFDPKECPFLDGVTFSAAGREAYEKKLRRLRKHWRRQCYIYNFEAVCNKDWWCTVADNSGRLFSNITSLPKDLRKHLLIEGEETVEIDIRNSQPFFALALYPSESEERNRYKDLVQSGLFYEKINNCLKKPILLNDDNARGRLKKRVFKEIFFGHVSEKYSLWIAFKRMFPELATIIETMKAGHHNQFAIHLQKTEATAIISGVLQEAGRRNLPILTVHDSVICRAKDAHEVEKVMNAHVERVVGEKPRLKLVVSEDLAENTGKYSSIERGA